MFEYIGNLHIHTHHSDGTGTVPQIARAAKKAGCDFIAINDHDYLTDELHLEAEGFHDGVLTLMGLEIGRRHHHYLAYNLKEMIRGDRLSPQQVIDRVNEQGGFGFLAHPFERGMPLLEKSIAYTWEDLSVSGYTGICLWNFTSRWKERIRTPLHGVLCLLFKVASLRGPSRETLGFWDDQCRHRRIVGIGASDAHASRFQMGAFQFVPLSYRFLLHSINVHILLENRLPQDLDGAKKAVYGALREGRCYLAHDNLCPASGFRFDFIDDEGRRMTMGEEEPFRPGTLKIETPARADIRLVRDGTPGVHKSGVAASVDINQKGVYRVEVYRRIPLLGRRPWIFSNPIYLR